jgi:hypothetical protein
MFEKLALSGSDGRGVKLMSGYGGVTFGKGLVDKELRVLTVLKKRHQLRAYLAK